MRTPAVPRSSATRLRLCHDYPLESNGVRYLKIPMNAA